jgi:hypothetical protein
MTRRQLAQLILRFGRNRAICATTIPELFHNNGRVLRSDELERYPKTWLTALLAKCAIAVESSSDSILGDPYEEDSELVQSISFTLDQLYDDFEGGHPGAEGG